MDLHQDLFHPETVHLQDGDGEVLIFKALPLLGVGAEHFQRPAAHGGALGLEGLVVQAHQLREIVDGHVAVQLIFAAGALHDLVLDLVCLVPDVAHDLLQHVLHGD